MSMDPGLDLHDWETEWQALEPLVRDSPEEALPELQRLVERVLDERGLPVDDVVAAEGIDPEVVADYDASRDLARRVDAGETIDPGDVAAAVNGFRSIFEHLVAERSAP